MSRALAARPFAAQAWAAAARWGCRQGELSANTRASCSAVGRALGRGPRRHRPADDLPATAGRAPPLALAARGAATSRASPGRVSLDSMRVARLAAARVARPSGASPPSATRGRAAAVLLKPRRPGGCAVPALRSLAGGDRARAVSARSRRASDGCPSPPGGQACLWPCSRETAGARARDLAGVRVRPKHCACRAIAALRRPGSAAASAEPWRRTHGPTLSGRNGPCRVVVGSSAETQLWRRWRHGCGDSRRAESGRSVRHGGTVLHQRIKGHMRG